MFLVTITNIIKKYPILNADGCIDEDLSYSLDPLTEQEKQKTLIDGISDFNIKVQVNGTTVL